MFYLLPIPSGDETWGMATNQPPPRITPEHIEEVIVDTDFYVFPGTTVTVCCLTLKNGAKVLGHNYGAIDATRQDWATGRFEARAMAIEKVGELEGYALRERLATPCETD